MINKAEYIGQPAAGKTWQTIDAILEKPDISSIDIGAAYITTSGIEVLMGATNINSCVKKKGVVKRWMTSFDYCRTDPDALKFLMELPSSSVRIHDAQNCLKNRGVPKVPYHPKTFLFHSPKFNYILAGSGNLSRSGLSRGIEAGIVIEYDRSKVLDKSPFHNTINLSQKWYDDIWDEGTPLNNALLTKYYSLCDSAERLKNAVPTEDDIATSDTSSGSLTNEQLKKLRICRHFWIDAGNVTKNRGPKLPGNQLMMKRLSRVFFGFEPTALQENSLVGEVRIEYGQIPTVCHLTYSDNKMDKLVLPIPGESGPEAYDKEILLFTKSGPKRYRVGLASNQEKGEWLKRSKAIEGWFKMSSGREWGVF